MARPSYRVAWHDRKMQRPPIARGNLRAGLPDALAGERFETLASDGGVRIERITSHGQASPPGFWYDQPQREWVLVVAGRAGLEIEGEDQPVVLSPGDWLDIPAYRRHRVLWTADGEPTVWLALHWPRT
jgi:cupin 2 domain-containing protein